MKAEVKEKEVSFKPIELVITIESVEDVKVLYALFNASVNTVTKMSENDKYPNMEIKNPYLIDNGIVWNEINSIANKLNLLK